MRQYETNSKLTRPVDSAGERSQIAHRPAEGLQSAPLTEPELFRGYQPRLCVRCGRMKREPSLYICMDCFTDPVRLMEQAAVERLPYPEQRTELIRRFHWYGEWPKDSK